MASASQTKKKIVRRNHRRVIIKKVSKAKKK